MTTTSDARRTSDVVVGRPEGAVLDVERSKVRRAAGDVLSAATHMDAITLHASDLPALRDYYSAALGLNILSDTGSGAVLGRGATPLVILKSAPGLPRPRRNEAGLFHTALLFADHRSLAAAVYSAARHPQSHYVGSADHGVSNAFYFTDPEGNGIELYMDRPREQWEYVNGTLRMYSKPLDAQRYLATHLSESSSDTDLDAAASVGHVHLQVGDLASAQDFYSGLLGFEVTTSVPGALFVSAGGYHHHMAMNTWNSVGAGLRGETLGLGKVAISVPQREDLEAAKRRLLARGIEIKDDGASLAVDDPWGTAVVLSVAKGSAAARGE